MGIGAYASALLVTRVGLSFWAALRSRPSWPRCWRSPSRPGAPRDRALLLPDHVRVLGGRPALLQQFLRRPVRRAVRLVGIPKPGALPWFGRALTFTTKLELYTLMAALLLVTAAVLVRLEHSRFGLVASAIRQGDLLAETLGVNVFRYKLTRTSWAAWPRRGRRLLRPTRIRCCTRATSAWSRWCCWSSSP